MFALALSGMSIGQLAIAVVIIAAVIAIVFVALRQMGVAIPPWAITMFWILVVCFVAVFAIRLLMSM